MYIMAHLGPEKVTEDVKYLTRQSGFADYSSQ